MTHWQWQGRLTRSTLNVGIAWRDFRLGEVGVSLVVSIVRQSTAAADFGKPNRSQLMAAFTLPDLLCTIAENAEMSISR